MMPHDRALELLTLSRQDEHAAHVLEHDDQISDSIVGFHYQQAAEKVLKALLAEHDLDFPKTHDLVQLLKLVEQKGYEPPASREDLARLTPFAVTLRYESGGPSDKLDRSQARKLIQMLREWAESRISV